MQTRKWQFSKIEALLYRKLYTMQWLFSNYKQLFIITILQYIFFLWAPHETNDDLPIELLILQWDYFYQVVQKQASFQLNPFKLHNCKHILDWWQLGHTVSNWDATPWNELIWKPIQNPSPICENVSAKCNWHDCTTNYCEKMRKAMEPKNL